MAVLLRKQLYSGIQQLGGWNRLLTGSEVVLCMVSEAHLSYTRTQQHPMREPGAPALDGIWIFSAQKPWQGTSCPDSEQNGSQNMTFILRAQQ